MCWVRYLGIVVGLGLCAFAIAFLSLQVGRKLDALSEANSDNVQWTLAQFEVEFLQFDLAVTTQASAPAAQAGALADIRRRFDIFYSRFDTIRNGRAYASLQGDADFTATLQRIDSFLTDSIPLIDGPDDALQAGLPGLVDAMVQLGDAVRTLSLYGLDQFARQSDASRESVASTLLTLALLTGALVAILSFVAVMLVRMIRLSERRGSEQRLTAARLQTIISTSLDAVLVVDGRGIVREFNGAAERVFGYTEAEVLGQPMIDMVIPEQYRAAHAAGMERHLTIGARHMIGAGRVELEGLRKSGEIFRVELSIDRVEGEDGPLFVSFIRDITERKQAESELVEARDRALAGENAKAEFLAVMSHEMRTPLNGLLGTMGLLKDSGLTPPQRVYLENMEVSGRLLLNHVNDVLDISKYEAGKFEITRRAFDLQALLAEITDSQQSVAAAQNDRLSHIWVGPPLSGVLGDPVRLRQVLLNLIGNALKFTRDGQITLEAETLSRAGPRHEVEFRVIDTGIGIDTADIDRIFGDFETLDSTYGRQAGGTGLGLGIARRLAHAMSGEIGVESEKGVGSRFWLRLPLEETSATTVQAGAESVAHAQLPPLDVLVVEDNRINRIVLREILERDGHSVTEASDGREGVQLAREKRFDAILMDISMPVMDGVAATRAIRDGDGASCAVPILAVTAHAMPEDLDTFRAAGMAGHIVKPITRPALAQQLRRLVGAHAGALGQAAPDTAAPELVDHAALATLREDLGAQTLAGLLSRCLAQGDEIIPAVSGAAAAMPLAEVLTRLHRLAGSVGALGCRALHQELSRLQSLGKSGHEDELRAGLHGLAPLWRDTRAGITDFLTE